MKAFTILHNGQKVAVVGAPKNSGVMVTVGCTVADLLPQDLLQLLVHRGRISINEDECSSETWPTPALAVGDEITIRIVDVDSDDPPTKSVPRKPKRPPRNENSDEEFDFNSRFGRFK